MNTYIPEWERADSPTRDMSDVDWKPVLQRAWETRRRLAAQAAA